MPKSAEREIKKRGGAVRYRSVDKDGKKMTCAVTKKAGPKGGKTVCWPRESVDRLATQIIGENDETTDQSYAALDVIEAAIAENKPITVTFGPKTLESIRYFLGKPHHRAAVQQMVSALETAFTG